MFEGKAGAMPENSNITEEVSGITDETSNNNIIFSKINESKYIHSEKYFPKTEKEIFLENAESTLALKMYRA